MKIKDEAKPYETLMKAVVIQAIREYSRTTEDIKKYVKPEKPYTTSDKNLMSKIRGQKVVRSGVVDWVKNMSGTFELAANAMEKEPIVLQEMMLSKMKDIDNGKKLKLEERK